MTDPAKALLAKSLGAKIVAQRKVLGLSQEKVAQRADISRETVRRIEAAETIPGVPVLYALATALQLSLWDLLPEDDAPFRPTLAEASGERHPSAFGKSDLTYSYVPSTVPFLFQAGTRKSA